MSAIGESISANGGSERECITLSATGVRAQLP